MKKREKMKLPETKRRRFIIKQERTTLKDALEASEGSSVNQVNYFISLEICDFYNDIKKNSSGKQIIHMEIKMEMYAYK